MANTSDKKWELTPYDHHRVPHEIFVGDIESAVTPKSLHKEFMCPICLGIMKKTMTTKDCLHRFCAECIITAIRNNNKECPTCRKKLISKRSLRHDKNFDALIVAIYPNLAEYEEQHERSIEKMNSSYVPTWSNHQKAQSTNSGQKPRRATELSADNDRQRENKRCKCASRSQTLPKSNSKRSESRTNLRSSNVKNEASDVTSSNDEVELILRQHPSSESMKSDKLRYIKTAASATVDHLKKYLIMRLYLDRESDLITESEIPIQLTLENVSIYIAHSSQNTIAVEGSETLEQLTKKTDKPNQPLEMYYSLTQI